MLHSQLLAAATMNLMSWYNYQNYTQTICPEANTTHKRCTPITKLLPTTTNYVAYWSMVGVPEKINRHHSSFCHLGTIHECDIWI